jgi:hypothetical protein
MRQNELAEGRLLAYSLCVRHLGKKAFHWPQIAPYHAIKRSQYGTTVLTLPQMTSTFRERKRQRPVKLFFGGFLTEQDAEAFFPGRVGAGLINRPPGRT